MRGSERGQKRLLVFAIVMAVTANASFAQSFEDLGAKQQYFPKGIFAQNHSNGDFVAGWYSSQLRALDESSLWIEQLGQHEMVYRFTWLRTFHHPIAARIVLNDGGTGNLYLKMADGAGGYSPGKIQVNSTFMLEKPEVDKILSLLAKMDFWHSPTTPKNESGGTDGSEWILEGRTPSAYHVIHRWTPRNGYLRQLGLYLVMDVGKLDIPKQEIY
jgi:hypothetical protein